MVSHYIKNLLGTVKSSEDLHRSNDEGPFITAHHLTRRAAALYEKIRGFVDYQEESQIKRKVIERIIKRKLLFGDEGTIGRSILEELVAAGYLPNNQIPETSAEKIQNILNFYRELCSAEGADKKKNNWVISMSAVEIHNSIFPNIIDDGIANMFVSIVSENIKFDDVSLSRSRREKVIILAVYKILFDSSLEEFQHILLKKIINNRTEIDEQERDSVLNIYQNFKNYIEDPLVRNVANKIKDLGVSVKLIREFIKEYEGVVAEELFADKELLKTRMAGYLKKNYEKETSYVRKNGVRAVIYLLCTKIVLALLIEVPVDVALTGQIFILALCINIIFHPLFLFAITRHSLGFTKENTDRAIIKALSIVEGHIEPIHIKTKSSATQELFYFLLYGLVYAVTFGLIVGFLVAIHFNAVSILLFLVFLALVSYFGMRIRGHALRWKVKTNNETILGTVGNVFMLPIIDLGQWLSVKFSTINAFVFILDFIIENPFKIVLRVINDFLYFLRDKKEEVF